MRSTLSATQLFHRSRLLVFAVALVATGTSAQAIESGSDAILRHGTILDLNALESRERRRSYQEQQQLYRELDRRPAIDLRQRPEIPRMERTCQLQAYGNRYLTTCR